MPSSIHPSIHPVIHPFIHSPFVRSAIHSCIHAFVRSCVRASCVRSAIHPCIHLFIPSYTHSATPATPPPQFDRKGKWNLSKAKLEVKSWRLRVFLVELTQALKAERDGTAVVANMDESYVHQGHCADMTWLPMDAYGNPITGMNRHVRDGARLILVIATSRWGPIVVRDEMGQPIVDRAWEPRFSELNRFGWSRDLTDNLVDDEGEFDHAQLRTNLTKLNAGEVEALFEELDGNTSSVYDQDVRLGPLQRPPLPVGTPVDLLYEGEGEGEGSGSDEEDRMSTSMWWDGTIVEVSTSDDPSKPHTYKVRYDDTEDSFSEGLTLGDDMNLPGELSLEDADTDEAVTDKRLKKTHKVAIRAGLEDAIFGRICAIYEAEKAKDDQTYSVLTDADQVYLKKAWDMAPTTEMIYVAGQAKGDYHKNMDTQMFLKWTKRLELSYPLWCKQMEELRSAGKLYPPVPDGDAHRFWDEENNKPARKLYCLLDNAPYHHGGEVNIMTKKKTWCANTLRRLGIKSIKIRLSAAPDDDGVQAAAGAGAAAGEGAAAAAAGGEGAGAGEGEGEGVLGPGQDAKGHFVRIAVPPGNESFKAKNLAGGYEPELVARATLEAMQEKAPRELVQPVRAIFEAHGWGLIWTPPYTSPWCWIELFWLAGKCFVAAAPQQKENRHLSDVADQLYTKWYGVDKLQERGDLNLDANVDLFETNKYWTDTSKHINECLELMNGWIEEDSKRAKENGHEGQHLVGMVDSDDHPLMWMTEDGPVEITPTLFQEWYSKAGVSEAAQEEALEMAFNANEDREDEDSSDEEDDDEGGN